MTGVGVVFLVCGTLPVPVIGILTLLIGGETVQLVNGASSGIVARTISCALTGLSLLYLDQSKKSPSKGDDVFASIDGSARLRLSLDAGTPTLVVRWCESHITRVARGEGGTWTLRRATVPR